MKKVYLGIAMHPKARQKLEENYEITTDINDFRYFDAAIVYSPPVEWADKKEMIRLKVISCHSWDEKITTWAKEQNIQLVAVPSLWHTVAEYTLALLMAVVRNIPQAHDDIRKKKWHDNEILKKRYSGYDFYGKTFGILGLGQIGLELAGIIQGFGMKLIYADIEAKPEAEKKYCIERRSIKELLEESDYLALLVPLNDSTKRIIGRNELKWVKPGSIWVNTARGPILDEVAFLEALKDGRITAAGLDVYWKEPLPKNHPLFAMDNVTLSPHLGGSTYDCDMVLVKGVINVLGENIL
jgi:phosphoglycerate dehydrogenase-like enzyme